MIKYILILFVLVSNVYSICILNNTCSECWSQDTNGNFEDQNECSFCYIRIKEGNVIYVATDRTHGNGWGCMSTSECNDKSGEEQFDGYLMYYHIIKYIPTDNITDECPTDEVLEDPDKHKITYFHETPAGIAILSIAAIVAIICCCYFGGGSCDSTTKPSSGQSFTDKMKETIHFNNMIRAQEEANAERASYRF